LDKKKGFIPLHSISKKGVVLLEVERVEKRSFFFLKKMKNDFES
jgi:hypothetical protein